MKTLVLGAGAWGTALAISASQKSTAAQVTLWARDPLQAHSMQQERCNQRYLPGVSFPPALQVASGALAASASLLARQDLIIIASPMAGLRGLLQQLAGVTVPVAWLCKGFELAAAENSSQVNAGDIAGNTSALAPSSVAYGLLGHEIQSAVAPSMHAGVLSGPSFAQEVALGKPTALVAASSHADVREALVQALHSNTLRVYANDDVVGVEVGGAVKNVLAIATGLCDGLQLGLNARAALITRGLSEISRLGLALGARADTFMGLSGLGDLVLTATGDLSRNRRVGLALAQGKTLEQAVEELGHVAEGVYSARTVVQRARHLGVDMPIAECVVDLLDGRIAPAQAVAALMGRGPRTESPPA